MGYWEQTGVSNHQRAERKANASYWARVDWMGVFAIVFAVFYWSLQILAVLRLFHLI
jgi:hypothetical protein